jgi:DNA segregation ATPase FtsK/SpoIIIE-like protein
VEILRDAAIEIDNRYNILADYGVKNISEYNAGKNEKMPRLVIVIDELYELMKCEDKTDVENVICRIAHHVFFPVPANLSEIIGL